MAQKIAVEPWKFQMRHGGCLRIKTDDNFFFLHKSFVMQYIESNRYVRRIRKGEVFFQKKDLTFLSSAPPFSLAVARRWMLGDESLTKIYFYEAEFIFQDGLVKAKGEKCYYVWLDIMLQILKGFFYWCCKSFCFEKAAGSTSKYLK